MNIFLTGATGFLGGRLICNLLEQEHAVYILARNLDKAEALKASLPQVFRKNVHILKGDIVKPNLGLSHDLMEELTNKIDIFYHLAALVKFDQDLKDTLMSLNYEGTKNAINFANTIKVPKFLHISTAYTVGVSNEGKEKLYDLNQAFNNPYEESKAFAEHEVMKFNESMDISIFRPAIIVGDSKTGEADSSFTLYGFMRGLELFKKRLDRKKYQDKVHLVGSKEGTSNLVPVDYVADILTLAAKKAERNRIYNITNPSPPTNREVLETIKQHLGFDSLGIYEKGTSFTLSPVEEQLNRMIDVFGPYLDRSINFEDNNTQALLAGSPIAHLNMTNEIVEIIVRAYFLQKKEALHA
ncbi:SDR family oxidoreductase [Sutcliffiella rhizosphaerae]|uniref:ADP-L-glycero-D-manno-heptose-6-epimerase n=1 Tax=Sutcliffiella rhizosphaerae TaxID=2880967 RepID=A0ABM8YP77_9BACI|nr:SDR family oxidoreductase [Sutcliffiella rhizosphaerae]CAG9621795.1 ADP-L-glycero-D-manno-heptose-6-epimerase [Sutcliffiella rhizosphaerae]